MRFFIDSADISEIKDLAELGVIAGVTTNPSLLAKTGKGLKELITEIVKIVPGPVSAQVLTQDCEQMYKDALMLSEIAENVVIKLPMTYDGLKVCHKLANRDIMVNITLCFSLSQALMAANAGASFVSPFIGRLDDINQNGLQLISDICQIFHSSDFDTEVLVASVRNSIHIIEAAKMGADIATIPAKLFRQMLDHPLTEKGLSLFYSEKVKY